MCAHGVGQGMVGVPGRPASKLYIPVGETRPYDTPRGSVEVIQVFQAGAGVEEDDALVRAQPARL
jgi:hypothetical protein